MTVSRNSPLIPRFGPLDVLLEEFLRKHLLQLHLLRDSRRVPLRILRRRLIIVDARLLRLTSHRRAKIATILLRLPALPARTRTSIGRRRLSLIWTRRPRGIPTAEILVLELVGQAIGHLVEAARGAEPCCRAGGRGEVLVLLEGGVVVEVSLAVDPACRLACAPDILLATSVWEGLREGGWGGGEGTTLFGGEVGLVVEAEVEVEAVGGGVAVVLLLLLLLLLGLLLVRHGEWVLLRNTRSVRVASEHML